MLLTQTEIWNKHGGDVEDVACKSAMPALHRLQVI